MEEEAHGIIGMVHITKGKLGAVKVPVPPPEEQQAIARFLDEEIQKIDDLIESKRSLLDLLKEKRQAVITHAVTRGLDPAAKLKPSGVEWLGDVPKHWAPKKLGYLAYMRGGSTPSKDNEEFWNGNTPWVSPKDMKSLVIEGSEDHVSESALKETNLKLIDPPVVLMVVRGMILAHSFPVGITTIPVTINQDMKALTPRDGISSEYLLHLLNGISNVALGAVNDSAHGTRVLRLPFWKHITVYLPEEQEQKEICEYVNMAHDNYDRMIAEVQTAIDRLHEYRASIISAAVTGKIDVRGERG